MFALLMEDVCQFKKLIYLFGNMEKAAQTQKILLSGSSKAQFNAQFFCRIFSQFFRFKVEGEWHHMQVSKKESLNLRNSIVRNCSAKQKKSSKLQSRKFQSFLKALSHLINFKRNNDWHQSRKFITDAKFYTSMHLALLNESRQRQTQWVVKISKAQKM